MRPHRSSPSLKPSPLFAAMLLFGCIVAAGCSGTQRPTPTSGSRVTAINLLAMPTAVNWDEKPGPDGIRVTVFLSRRGQSRSIPLSHGTLEFLLYSGTMRGGELAATEPLMSWGFSPRDLTPFLVDTVVGPGYAVSLGWGVNSPRDANVTLLVRYRDPGGTLVQASALSLAVRPG